MVAKLSTSLMVLVVVRSAGIIRKVHRYHVRLGNTDMVSRMLIRAEEVTAGDSSDSATNALPFSVHTAAALIIGFAKSLPPTLSGSCRSVSNPDREPV